jgi:hypothetical protein
VQQTSSDRGHSHVLSKNVEQHIQENSIVSIAAGASIPMPFFVTLSIVPYREKWILAGGVLSFVLWGREDFVSAIGCCPIVSDLSRRAFLKEWANHQLLISCVCAARLCVHLCLLQPDSPNFLSTCPEAAEPPVESIKLSFIGDLHPSKEIPDAQGKV